MVHSFFKTHLRHLAVYSVTLLLVLQACISNQEMRGNLTDQNQVSELLLGIHTRADVSALLGNPSALSSFDSNVWYYIGQQKERTAFFSPKLKDQKILRITFNQKGTIESIDDITSQTEHDIKPVSRKTKTAGKSLTLFEQLIGNIGKFKK